MTLDPMDWFGQRYSFHLELHTTHTKYHDYDRWYELNSIVQVMCDDQVKDTSKTKVPQYHDQSIERHRNYPCVTLGYMVEAKQES